MKSIGIIRRVDNLGRIVIPKELRDAFNWNTQTPLEIFTDKETIIIKKYNPGCCICKEIKDDMINYNNNIICKECIRKISEML